MTHSTREGPAGNADDGGAKHGPATGISPPRQHLAAPAQLPALTSTRFFGALMIMVFHTTADTPLLAGAPFWLRSLITSGYVWVGYFFVLSGFILTYQYLDRFRAGAFDARDFWLARLARIYPGHVAGFVLIFLIGLRFSTLPLGPQHAARAVTAADVGLTAVLMHAWVPTFALTYNFPSWALSVEWFFYLLFPLLLIAAARWPLRRVLMLAAIGLAAEWTASLVYCATAAQGWAGNTTNVNTAAIAFIKFSPALRLAEFMLGVALARVYAERERLRLDERFGGRLIAVSMCAIAAGLLSSFAIPFALMHNVVLTIPFGAAILGFALAPKGMVSRALSLRWLVVLGEASYPLYILHGSFVFSIYAIGWMNRVTGLEAVAGRAVLILAAICAALLFHRYVEAPARRWIRSHGRRRGGTPAPSV
ncbi:MAG: acyltransferase [Candidatus Krumholzibacteriaceae bacterium]|jgi:peptidoglycan/LPS O-acetylase OafA/YrhL